MRVIPVQMAYTYKPGMTSTLGKMDSCLRRNDRRGKGEETVYPLKGPQSKANAVIFGHRKPEKKSDDRYYTGYKILDFFLNLYYWTKDFVSLVFLNLKEALSIEPHHHHDHDEPKKPATEKEKKHDHEPVCNHDHAPGKSHQHGPGCGHDHDHHHGPGCDHDH